MIKIGTTVRRVGDEMLTHIRANVLRHEYPPPDLACIVISNPKEVDLSPQRRSWGGDQFVSLGKAIDVMCENKVCERCELQAFQEL